MTTQKEVLDLNTQQDILSEDIYVLKKLFPEKVQREASGIYQASCLYGK